MEGNVDRPVIVVGVDGSESSIEALRWAYGQAELTGAELHAVMAWQLPEVYAYGPADYEEKARKALDSAVEQTLGPTPPIPVVKIVEPGRPASVLIEASRRAQLLVVGSHGHGGFTGMLLGSVGQHCVSHADCPVVVVRRRTQ